MQRRSAFSVGEYYHIYNRGTDKREIFLDKPDYLRFIVLLYISNNVDAVHVSNLKYQGRTLMGILNIDKKDSLVDIGAYCLMPNHFHILIKEKIDNGISQFIRKLSTGYSMYFNKRYERTGNLFQGKFKSMHVDNDQYLKYLFAYIHLNPIKIIEPGWKELGIREKDKAESFLKDYEFSSYMDYDGNGTERVEAKIVKKESFPEYFLTAKDFNDMIKDWLYYKDTIKVGP
ncbi:MAG: transposase [Candidatus Pacebacteria bacterium]|nr:transposase [Candidatus Paceibacterota bacterium]NUQ57221.1 transposase [Candidatus Paceibacter sp.]